MESPRDFESGFRNSPPSQLATDMIPSGAAGCSASWDRLVSGVDNPMEDGDSRLDWDGDNLSANGARIEATLASSPTHTSFVSVYNDDQPSPANVEDQHQDCIEFEESSDNGNPNEDAVPPEASEVPATRLSDFHCGCPAYEYPSPNMTEAYQNHSEQRKDDGPYCRNCGQPGHWRGDCPRLYSNQAKIKCDSGHKDNSRCGGLNDMMKGKFTLLFSDAKLEALLPGLVDSAKSSYKSDRLGWGRFCFVRGVPIWLEPGKPGWGEPLLDFFRWASKVPGRKESALKGRFAAIRLMHLIEGNVGFSTQAHRVKALIKGLKKRGCVARKQPFNADLLRWVRKELVDKSAMRSNGTGSMYFELFTACVLGFFFRLRISELEAPKWEDIAVDAQGGGGLSYRLGFANQKTDVSKDGISRSLIEIDSVLFICEISKNGKRDIQKR